MFTKVRRAMPEQIEIFNKNMDTIKKYKTEIIELKNIITKLKNSIEKLTSV